MRVMHGEDNWRKLNKQFPIWACSEAWKKRKGPEGKKRATRKRRWSSERQSVWRNFEVWVRRVLATASWSSNSGSDRCGQRGF